MYEINGKQEYVHMMSILPGYVKFYYCLLSQQEVVVSVEKVHNMYICYDPYIHGW